MDPNDYPKTKTNNNIKRWYLTLSSAGIDVELKLSCKMMYCWVTDPETILYIQKEKVQ